MSDKMMLTLQDLQILAATAERNGTSRNFPEVALQWAAGSQAEIERLRAALTLAANRLDVLALDHDYGTTRRNITDEWAKEARKALGPNVRAKPGQTAQEG